MIFKLAFIIASIVSQTDAAQEIKASGGGKKRISHLRKVQIDASIAIKDNDVSKDVSNQRDLEIRRRRGKAGKTSRDAGPIEPTDDREEWEEDNNRKAFVSGL